MLEGVVIFSIWTPLSVDDATAAYVSLPDLNVVISYAPSSSRLVVSPILPAAVMLRGVGDI